METKVIGSFTGEYRFLSNFYPTTVVYEGRSYKTAEHAYVAAKTTDEKIRAQIQSLKTPAEAKAFGRTIDLRPNWIDIKIREMRRILENKFSILRSDTYVRVLLDKTAPAILIEGNTWGDRFWGESPIGVGRNELGKILMSIRDDDITKFIL